VADVSAIRVALANQITTVTGMRTLAEAKDQISPPVAVILPGQPFVTYGLTMDGAFSVNLRVLLIISDAGPNEKVQRALDAYLGSGSGVSASSIANALRADPTLGGVVHFAETISVGNYNRLEYAGLPYFGARLEVQIGAI
jgi:hypothetical protein